MNDSELKTIHLAYYALLKEKIGLSEETIETVAVTARDLYHEVADLYGLNLSTDSLKVSVNDAFSTWQTQLKSGDCVAFIPPVSGG